MSAFRAFACSERTVGYIALKPMNLKMKDGTYQNVVQGDSVDNAELDDIMLHRMVRLNFISADGGFSPAREKAEPVIEAAQAAKAPKKGKAA